MMETLNMSTGSESSTQLTTALNTHVRAKNSVIPWLSNLEREQINIVRYLFAFYDAAGFDEVPTAAVRLSASGVDGGQLCSTTSR